MDSSECSSTVSSVSVARRRTAGRWASGVVFALVAACTGETTPETPDDPSVPRLPVALVGSWLNIGTGRLRGDTLRLSADSLADAIIPWGQRYAKVHRWKVIFGSRDPVGTREDWRGGYSDGGDPECIFGNGDGCVSLPMLCLGATKEYSCAAFAIAGDTLLVASGLKYLRLGRTSTP